MWDMPPTDHIYGVRSWDQQQLATPYFEVLGSRYLTQRSLPQTTAHGLSSEATAPWSRSRTSGKRMKRRSRHISTRKKIFVHTTTQFACGKAFKRRLKMQHERGLVWGLDQIPFPSIFLSRRAFSSRGIIKGVQDTSLCIRRIWVSALLAFLGGFHVSLKTGGVVRLERSSPSKSFLARTKKLRTLVFDLLVNFVPSRSSP